MTRTYAILRIPRATYNEIETVLRAAGYAYALERLSNGEPVIAMNDIALAPDEPDMVCRPAYPSNSQQRRAARHVIDDVVSEANAPSPRLRTYWFNRIRHLFT